jgi:nucleotide-binding universal stress UspA family protein
MPPLAGAPSFRRMATQDPQTRAPIVAAFNAAAGVREPVEFGIAAARVTGAPLVVATVRRGGPVVRQIVGDIDEGDEERSLNHLRLDLQRRRLDDVEVRSFDDRTAARGLAVALDELKPALIVLGSSHRSAVGSMLVGTTAERVLHASSCPVAIVPKGYTPPEGGIRVVGAAFTATDEGREALNAGASLARAAHATLRAITVLDPEHASEQSDSLMAYHHHDTSVSESESAVKRLADEAQLRDAVAKLGEGIEIDMDVLVAEPADGLVAAARNLDLLVMGSRALGPKRAVLLGSVSRKVTAQASCPVLILPRGATDKTAALLAAVEAQS